MANDIKIYVGNDKDLDLEVKDSSGTAIDITDYDIFFTAKKEYDDEDDDAVIKVDQTVSDGSDGKVTITIPKEDTEDLTPMTYVYDVQWKDTDGKIKTLLVGDLNVYNKVTDRTTKET